MSFRIDRTPRASSPRRAAKAPARKAEPASVSAGAQLPVAVGAAVVHPHAEPTGESIFEAQLFGQDGERRGLRAGQPLIDAANGLYNRTEWSGSRDRRARKGRRARAEA